jgi:L-ascorbate metabolism protein UlaG (beta-lactamase superfamily)
MSDDHAAAGDDVPRRRCPYRWLGHATVLLPGPPAVAVDPWRWRLDAVADLVLVTSGHVDHCSEDDIAAARREGATIVAPPGIAERLRATFGDDVATLHAGETCMFAGAAVSALPAEGPTRDGVASGFLPRGAGLTYLVESGETRVLFLGDSVVLPEHHGLAPELAFVAVGGMVTSSPEEAAASAGALDAGVVVPVHWGDLEARHAAAQRFVELCAAAGVAAATPTPGGSAHGGPDQG